MTGYAHSANGLDVNPAAASRRLLARARRQQRRRRSAPRRGRQVAAARGVRGDRRRQRRQPDRRRSSSASAPRARPTAAEPRDPRDERHRGAGNLRHDRDGRLRLHQRHGHRRGSPEWNCWYHIMNCGFPLKVSGETDFPCITGSRVGQGRVYVQLGKTDAVDLRRVVHGHRGGPVVRLRRLRPRPGVHGRRPEPAARGWS